MKIDEFLDIFILMSSKNFMLSLVEWEKSFMTSGPDHVYICPLWFLLCLVPQFKVFPSTNCPYRGVKVRSFRKSVKVLTGEVSTFTFKFLQNNTSNAIDKLNLMKI